MGGVHHTDTGSGTPFLLLHAFPLDSRMWDPVRAELSEHVRLITPDLPGFGRSPVPQAPPSLEATAADLVGLLDDLGVERAVVGGSSLGGYVLMAMLRAAPERVSGAVFIGTKATADTPDAAANRETLARRAEADGVVPWLAESMLPNLLHDQTAAPALRATIDGQSPAGVAWTARAMAVRPDSRETLRALDLDALVVHGAHDALMPPGAGQDIADLTGARLHVVPTAGHLPGYETPRDFLDAVIPWLAR
ncbi:alpha/beta fold hydrolase [Actinokineospora sp. PR83]|uniref:alpha/beta fold hydrolase n=1 Tax=Actinokineospora sp. PR83 TaxID=2884908 RepID=UPI001F2EEC4F|nr:alpha/beta fold hydrolase [Actinokineospora sp. PR83]MCG8919612.1 alpha/beta fold hydrolase [Actinokineospora sp. PR83]